MASALVLGATGMVGSHILSTLRNAAPSQISKVDIIARRSPPAPSNTNAIPVNEVVSKDTATWSNSLSSLKPSPTILFSALATTRGAAGGFEKQYVIEHDLNIELAKAAKLAGTKTYILISGSGADPNSMFGYVKMKGEIEEHVKEIGFDHTIIIRPGLIGGQREESRPAEAVLRKLATGLGWINTRWLKDTWVQDADVIAKAAVSAALKIESGDVQEKVWVIGQSEIIKLGRTEWKHN